MKEIDYKEWKHDVRRILTDILKALERDDIDRVCDYLVGSPAGDEMGDDNTTIKYKKFDGKFHKGDIFDPIYGGFKVNRNLPENLLEEVKKARHWD
jgi:hypothetical protein